MYSENLFHPNGSALIIAETIQITELLYLLLGITAHNLKAPAFF